MASKHRTIWITGASSGIGLELTRQLADKGARIILSSRRGEELENIAEHLPGGLRKHHIVPLDLSRPEAVLETCSHWLAETEIPIDILINNGGISQRALFRDSELSVYRQLMEVNYLGTVAMTKAVVPGMIDRGEGMVVSISSVAGKIGSKLRTGYSGSKFAVVGFMDCLRAELDEHNIHCLTVCPGFIRTNIAWNALDGQGNPKQQKGLAIEGGMEPGDCSRQIIRAMEAGKDEVIIGKGISKLAPTIKRFAPGLFNRLTARREYK